jgi:DnaJ family protein C protein 13
VPTRLVVTPTHLLERSVTSHALERRTPLASIAALVRFASDPKLLGVEWEGGGPPSAYVTVARDAVLALLLDAAQGAAGRPIAVLPGEEEREWT